MQLDVPQITPEMMTARFFYAPRGSEVGKLCLLTMAAHEDLFLAYQEAGRKVSEAYKLPHLKAFKFQLDSKGRVCNIVIYRVDKDMHLEALQRLHPTLMPVKGIRVRALRFNSKSKEAKGLAKLVGKVEQYENFQHYLMGKLAQSAGVPVTDDMMRVQIGTLPCVDGSTCVAVSTAWHTHIEVLIKCGFEEITEQDFNLKRAEALDFGEKALAAQAQTEAKALANT